jgi:tRNA(fMet)-specific endonuclease VapC
MEKALYDTSAVIELIARKKQVLTGYISILTAIEYPPAIQYAREILYPRKEDYTQAVKWQIQLRKQGTPLPAIDLLIAAQSLNNQLTLVTLDKHFKTLKEKATPELKLKTRI